jgi:hypothetical protein
VNALQSGSELDDCLERLLTARSIDELGLDVPGSNQR